MIFLQVWEGTWKYRLPFLVWSEVTKGLSFVLAAVDLVIPLFRYISFNSASPFVKEA